MLQLIHGWLSSLMVRFPVIFGGTYALCAYLEVSMCPNFFQSFGGTLCIGCAYLRSYFYFSSPLFVTYAIMCLSWKFFLFFQSTLKSVPMHYPDTAYLEVRVLFFQSFGGTYALCAYLEVISIFPVHLAVPMHYVLIPGSY